MRHRAGSSKIKYDHTMIEELRKFLESIESWSEIQSIIPGRINHVGRPTNFRIRIQYDTRTGIKCLVRSRSAVQEVFFVTPDRNALRNHLSQTRQFS